MSQEQFVYNAICLCNLTKKGVKFLKKENNGEGQTAKQNLFNLINTCGGSEKKMC